MDGQAVATVADQRYTTLFIGGAGSTAPGGKGFATVSGADSEIRLTGYDTNIAVGFGPQAVGQLTIADQGKVSAIGLSVGAAGAGVYLGGSALRPGGDGSLTMTGGSQINIQAAPGLGMLRIGRDGSKMILEVESNGAGGFNTDHVIFKGGQPLDLTHLNAEFRFLGATDPNAFGTSGLFNINTFFQERQADNSLAALAPSVFSTAMFKAQADSYQITSFSFSAATGGTIIAQAVPEPEAWALMVAGLLTIAGIARRRSRTRPA
jgi:T5SS/PEP-CTERM-associated repeat protein